MTNFRYSQNPRVARKRPSRASRIATRRNVSDNRHRERPEALRSARRNKRANLTLTPSDITWVAREREHGFFWVEGTDSEGYHYRQGLVPASNAREAIEDMEEFYQYELENGGSIFEGHRHTTSRRRPHTARRANRRRSHPVQHRANRRRSGGNSDW